MIHSFLHGSPRYCGNGLSVLLMLLSAAFWVFVYGPYMFLYFSPFIAPDTTEYYKAAELLLTGRADEVQHLAIDLPMGVPYLLWFFNAAELGHFWYILAQTLTLHLSFGVLAVVIGRRIPVLGLLVLAGSCLYLLNPDVIFTSVAILTEAYYSASLVLVLAGIFAVSTSEGKARAWWLTLLGIVVTLPLLFRSNGIYVFVLVPALLWCLGLSIREMNGLWKGLGGATLVFLILSFTLLGYANYGNLARMSKVVERISSAKQMSKKKVPMKESDSVEVKMQSMGYRIYWYTIESWPKVAQGNLRTSVKPFYNTYLRFMVHDSYLRPESELRLVRHDPANIVEATEGLTALKYSHAFNSERGPSYWAAAHERLNPDLRQSRWITVHMLLYQMLYAGDGLLRGRWVSHLWLLLAALLAVMWFFRRGDHMLGLALCANALHYGGIVLISVAHANLVVRYVLVSQFAFYVTMAVAVCFAIRELSRATGHADQGL